MARTYDTFPYPSKAKSVWDGWQEGRERLEKIVGGKVTLVEGWGDTLEAYNRAKAHPAFVTSYYPMGAGFYLMKEEEALKSTQPEQGRCLRHIAPGGESFYLSGNIAQFNLTQFPSCCGLLLSYTTMVRSEWQKKGIGALVMELKEKIAREAGYTRLMGTLILPSMTAEKKLWDRSGWKVVEEWRNRRSGNMVVTGQKDLTIAL